MRIAALSVFAGVFALLGSHGARPGPVEQTAAGVLARAIKAIAAVKTLDCTIEVQIVGFGSSPAVRRAEKYRIVYADPRKVAVRELSFEVQGPESSDKQALAYTRYCSEIVSDGNRYYALDAQRRRYVVHALSRKGVEGEETGSGIFSDYVLGDVLYHGGEGYLKDARHNGKHLGREQVGGVLCDKIATTEGTVMWIGVTDSIIRKCQVTTKSSMSIIERYTIASVDAPQPPSKFRISPPSSARRVNKL